MTLLNKPSVNIKTCRIILTVFLFTYEMENKSLLFSRDFK